MIGVAVNICEMLSLTNKISKLQLVYYYYTFEVKGGLKLFKASFFNIRDQFRILVKPFKHGAGIQETGRRGGVDQEF